MSTAHASLQIDVLRSLKGEIDPRIYSGFTEHMGRCIYGGIYEEGSSLSDERGFRTDVLDALRELKPPVVRWPGGNFVCSYRWTDGIGPKDKRPARPELAWRGVESNRFGTDEFMEWAKELGTDCMLCLNMGTGTLEDALAWIEYCNGAQDTYWANKRREHGHPEPYGIKLISLGNEPWGPWQVAEWTAEDYGKTARQWAKAIKLLDPNVELIACGAEGFDGVAEDNWEAKVLKHVVDVVDYISLHLYTRGPTHEINVMTPSACEKAIRNAETLIELAMVSKKTSNRPKICFDEWNCWDADAYPGEKGAEQVYTMSDALAVAIYLNIFIRTSTAIACIAQSVNVISPLLVRPDGILKQTTWWTLELFAKYMHGKALDIGIVSGSWDAQGGTPDRPWVAELCKPSFGWIDGTVTIDEKESMMNIMIVNRHKDQAADVDLNFATANHKLGEKMTVFELHHEDMMAINSWEAPDTVKPVKTEEKLGKSVKMKAGSLKLLRIPYQA